MISLTAAQIKKKHLSLSPTLSLPSCLKALLKSFAPLSSCQANGIWCSEPHSGLNAPTVYAH